MTSQERQLCGVAAHEQLLKERDELRVVLSDLLQERNWEHRIGAMQEAERELRLTVDIFWYTGSPSDTWDAAIRRVLKLLSEALRGLPAYPAPAPAPAPAPVPQEACCHVYVGDLGEMHQPNCTRRRQALRDVLGTEAEAEAAPEARPATDSTHE